MTAGARPVVVGVADHYGYATLVSAALEGDEPSVVDRRRVPLIEEGVPASPYHHDTLALRDDEAEGLLRDVERSIAACTAAALDRLSSDLAPRYRVMSIAIRQPPLDSLPKTVREVHASYAVQCRADGMLYHQAICAAARERGWAVALHRRGDELTIAAQALKVSPHEFERFLADLKATLKSPWTAEHRRAFAAAVARLPA